jgi:hypothetical protein
MMCPMSTQEDPCAGKAAGCCTRDCQCKSTQKCCQPACGCNKVCTDVTSIKPVATPIVAPVAAPIANGAKT